MAVRGCFSSPSMGQVTGVWPTPADGPQRKELASSKNVGFVVFASTHPAAHPKTSREMGVSIFVFSFRIFITLRVKRLGGRRWSVGGGGGAHGRREEAANVNLSSDEGGPDMEAGHEVLIKPVLREGLTAKAWRPLLVKTGQ